MNNEPIPEGKPLTWQEWLVVVVLASLLGAVAGLLVAAVLEALAQAKGSF